eukprot:gnl/Carplike_NY0171/8417_a11676_160.p1 GENE.gnl/Carplike_NY0171/8417_a11676_160~~gnl/Carplike_NY0171/8417_a11676_160.p1  ORF type:complete len:200 (+),score=31.48 gnl/Carplike_NY0171/8417_a11676_160:63-602(+)
MRNNTVEGTIPDGICSLSNLQYLNLVNNYITGEIPQCICNLDQIKYIYLSQNMLEGAVPDCSEGEYDVEIPLYSLIEMHVDCNYLDGELSLYFLSLPYLKEIYTFCTELACVEEYEILLGLGYRCTETEAYCEICLKVPILPHCAPYVVYSETCGKYYPIEPPVNPSPPTDSHCNIIVE